LDPINTLDVTSGVFAKDVCSSREGSLDVTSGDTLRVMARRLHQSEIIMFRMEEICHDLMTISSPIKKLFTFIDVLLKLLF